MFYAKSTARISSNIPLLKYPCKMQITTEIYRQTVNPYLRVRGRKESQREGEHGIAIAKPKDYALLKIRGQNKLLLIQIKIMFL